MSRWCLTLVFFAGCAAQPPALPEPPPRPPRAIAKLPHGALLRIGSPAFRHDDPITAVATSRDGAFIASSSRDAAIHLWDARKRTLLRTMRATGPTVSSLAFSPDGATLASTSARGTISLWATATGEETELRGHLGRVANAAFSPDGRTLASASYDMTVQIWDVATRVSYCALIGHANFVHALAFSPDGRTLASGSYDHTIRLWSLPPEREPLTIYYGGELLLSLACAPHGRAVAAALSDGSIRAWDSATGSPLFRQPAHIGWVRAIAYAPDGATIASAGDDGIIRLADARTGRAVSWLPGHADAVTSLAFLPDGTLVSGGADKHVRLWDTVQGREIALHDGHADSLSSITFSPDGASLFTGSLDGTVREWSLADGSERRFLRHPTRVTTIALSPDGRHLLVGGTLGVLRLCDLGATQGSLTLGGLGRDIIALSFRADHIAAGGAEGTTTYWPVNGDPPEQYLPVLGASAMTFCPDGETVAVASDRIKLARKGVVIAELTGHAGRVLALAASPVSPLLASGGSDRTIVLWDLDRQTPRVAFDAHAGAVRALAFSADGKLLASAGADHCVRVWESATGSEVLRIETPDTLATALAFSPDGRSFATAMADSTAIVWSLVPAELLPLDDALAALDGKDARRAYAAIWSLAAAGDRAVETIAGHLVLSSANPVRPLIQGLNADDIGERDRLSAELQKLGADAEPELRDALKEAPTSEVADRIRTLLDHLGPTSLGAAPILRTILALERIGTADAIDLLRAIADRHASAGARRDARRALAGRKD